MEYFFPSNAGRDLPVLCQPHAAPGVPVLVISSASLGQGRHGTVLLSLLLP